MPDDTSADPAGTRPRVLHLISEPRRGGAQNFARDLHRELRRRGQASALCALAPHPAPRPAGPALPGPRTEACTGECTGAHGAHPTAHGAHPTAHGAHPTAHDVRPTAHDVRPDAYDARPDTYADAAGLHAAAVLGSGRLHPGTLRALRATARAADVVLAHGSDTLAACALALAGTRTPFVYVSVGHPRYWTANRLRRVRGGALMHRAAAVTTLTTEARTVLEEQFRLPDGKVHVIPNSRAAESYPPADGRADRRAARHALGLPADVLLVAWIGAIAPEKRLDLALDVLDRLPDVRLAVAGDGPLRETLARHPAAARAHFLGALPDPAPLYRAADALLLTSDSEGVPGALIEAALAGVPAVATDVGWVREVVRDGATGALVAPGDPLALAEALAKVLACNRAGLGAAARAHALEHFELGAVVDAWQRLVAEVWAGGGAGARPGP
ncbi:glycosyltransferase involved in cell wall biosynthesis [Kitasatospora sp. MAA19]|uniref:glycosyltransferase family 4 protein n=1 Tax=Kitasatospora sp. MAA19 TaxID=3035090 RepID=UPI002475A8CC|nr:glycosyltransferase family 4 protein [Kitasatospora sp. MAA19]MDH6710226.1 glycosyltransferase involved in cell wall biosynthesis [Kitasatospora sp. MAA19]